MSRILVVDDDPDVQQTMARMLATAGHAVCLPQAGLDLLSQIEQSDVDLVVTDMKMPSVDGWHVLGWMRANRPGIAVLLVSGEDIDRMGVRPSQFDAYLPKPVRRRALIDAVARLLRSGRS